MLITRFLVLLEDSDLEFMVLFRVKFYYYSVNKYFKTSGSIPGIPFKTKINPGIILKYFMNFKTDLNFRKRL
jgi:hypothetical protein